MRLNFRPFWAAAISLACLVAPSSAFAVASPAAQDSTAAAASSEDTGSHGRLLLVLPFDNASGQPNLGWISEAFPAIFNRRLASSGFMPISRDDRLYALDHLGLPQSFQPSRASAIRLAQTLDANYVVFGSFSMEGQRFNANVRILNMNTLHLSAPIEEQADLSRLLDVLNGLAWRVAKELDPQFRVAEKTFVAADSNLGLSVFEHYIRGLVAPDIDQRIDRLKEAVQLDPAYAPAIFALGKAYFADQQYELAATTFGHLPKEDANAREADFYRGLAYLYVGNYIKAEDAFAFVTRQLPLPEVVNNQGVAASRRGKDGTALFLQAVVADPNDPDYQFNLAVALSRKNDISGALQAVGRCLKLRPQDSEAKALEDMLRRRMQSSSAAQNDSTAARNNSPQEAATSDDAEPLERVKRTFNEASFRQAAFEMEQIEDARLSSLPPAQHAAKLTEQGTKFLQQGLILEAEREFQAALQADDSDAGAHAGLAIVRERGGDADAARQEAQDSLKLKPSVTAYLVLARLDMAANQMPAAAGDVGHALQLEPQNAAARGLRQQLEAKGQQIP